MSNNRKHPPDTLHLVLAYVWYDMIERGEKLEEYRSTCDTWNKRIWDKRFVLKKVVLHRGYTKRVMEFKIDMIAMSLEPYTSVDFVTARKKLSLDFDPSWGYNDNEPCYIIRLGERIR